MMVVVIMQWKIMTVMETVRLKLIVQVNVVVMLWMMNVANVVVMVLMWVHVTVMVM